MVLNKTIKIHTVGDSHAKIPWDDITLDNIEIDVHHLGPRLMHTVSKKPWLTSVKNFNIRKKDIIIYCFGEIDCFLCMFSFICCGAQLLTSPSRSSMFFVQKL